MVKERVVKKSKYADLIKSIKESNPIDQWNVKIKAAIAAEVKNSPTDVSSTDPMGITKDTISSFASIDVVREEALKILKSNKVISQFVRPGKKKLSKVITDTETGEVLKKFRRNPPVGILVAFVDNNNLLIGWSKYNKNNEILPFSKKIAAETAVMRGLLDRIYPYGPNGYTTAKGLYIPKLIAKDLPNFLKRVEGVFDRKADNVGVFMGTA